jgi:hypothetical protein
MDTKKILKGAAIIGGCYFIWKQYQNASELGQSLVFAPQAISLDTTHIFAPVLKLSLQITNPSPNSVSLSKIFATVVIEDTQVGTVNNDNSLNIAGTATTLLTLNITLNSLAIVTMLSDLDMSNLNRLNMTISGYYVANLIRLPLVLQVGQKIGKKKIFDGKTNYPISYKMNDGSTISFGSFTRNDYKGSDGKKYSNIIITFNSKYEYVDQANYRNENGTTTYINTNIPYAVVLKRPTEIDINILMLNHDTWQRFGLISIPLKNDKDTGAIVKKY